MQEINTTDMVVRLLISFVAGTIIGLERARKHQVAGLRTHILICMGSTLLMILSIWMPQVNYHTTLNGDPGRIAAQVVSGIGFLGAGAIIRMGNSVKGLTTAASIWFTAGIGLAIGAGMIVGAIVAEVLGLVALIVLGNIEGRIFPAVQYKTIDVTYKINKPDTALVQNIVRDAGLSTQSSGITEGSKDKGAKLHLLVSIPKDADIGDLARRIKGADDVAKVDIGEK
jgi:putative Mg2+ transporter-C (MgtC) family protein